jgi:DnaJ-like protein
MTEPRDPYDVLGLRRGASSREIRAAYRALARQHHPDLSADPTSAARMIEVNVAWESLRLVLRGGAGPTVYDPAPGSAGASAAPTSPPDKRHVRKGKGGVEVVWRRGPNGQGAAGPPPGRPSGTILTFGRYIAWSLGEVARTDPWYLLWLEEREEAQAFLPELQEWLVSLGIRRAPTTARR